MISIIIPVYNVSKYLDKCLKSVVTQTYSNIQIILVNDGSTDNSGEICEKWCKKDKRIEVIHKRNGGLSNARNVGIERAQGEYLMFVDSDDIISDDLCELLHDRLLENNADLAICDTYHIFDNNNFTFQRDNKVEIVRCFDKIEAIICSMTVEEKRNTKLLNGSRRLRIAKGSGTTVQDVNKFMKSFEMTQKMMKQMKSNKGGMKNMFKNMNMNDLKNFKM